MARPSLTEPELDRLADVAFAALCDSPRPLGPAALGRILHADAGRHDADSRCGWCPVDGWIAAKHLEAQGRARRLRTNAFRPV